MATLPNTDISIMDVRNCIGCSSIDLGSLVANAKEGGTGGFAFQINENGFSGTKLGYLIDGARPYWNIWSKNSPGKFEFYTDGTIKYRLRTNGNSDTINPYYRYALGDFRNYNHSAPEPSVRCTNAVNDVLSYYQSTGEIQVVYTITTSEINWSSYLTVNHFYLRIVGIRSGGETELAFIESPSYVKVDGTSTSYNGRYEIQTYTTYNNIRLELWLGYNNGSEVINKSKVPFIDSHTVKLQQMREGVSAGNILWFYIYNTSTSIEDVAIPDFATKIPVSNKTMDFQANTGTPNVGRYVFKFSARINGDYYVNIPNYGSQAINGNWEVLAQGVIYKNDGTTKQINYESLGTIYLDTNSSYNNYQLEIPTTWANNRYDTGMVHLFLRLKDRP